MKKLHLILFTLVIIYFSDYLYCQEAQPFIISIEPDSLFHNYEYSQTAFFVVSIESQVLSDPTESAINELNEKIVNTCKQNKFDGFILNQLVYTKPFDEGKLIAYGTLLRAKPKKPVE